MTGTAPDGGRTWWAHFEFTSINIEPIILKNKIEDLREAPGVFATFDKVTMRPDSRYGSAFSNTALTTLKTAVFASIATVMMRTQRSVKQGSAAALAVRTGNPGGIDERDAPRQVYLGEPCGKR